MHLIEDARAKFSTIPPKHEKKMTTMDAKAMKYSYTCNLCNFTFLDNERWKTHKTSHGNKTWKCKFCSELLEDRSVLATHLNTKHGVDRDEMESMGFLKAIPLVIIKAVTEADVANLESLEKDSESDYSGTDESEPEMDLFGQQSFKNYSTERSNSATSIDLQQITPSFDLRPASACTDTSDSLNTSFEMTKNTKIDESMFDAANLTCKLCKKVLRNIRTFKNHRDRHLGNLNHKCPECSKTFEGRSAVNRHMITNHNRELQAHEITSNPSATSTAVKLSLIHI